jgi:hypothetical protein
MGKEVVSPLNPPRGKLDAFYEKAVYYFFFNSLLII